MEECMSEPDEEFPSLRKLIEIRAAGKEKLVSRKW